MASINLVFENGLSASASNVYSTVAPIASPTFTGTATIPNITMSGSINSVSATELNYLDGVTSAIQSQFTAKAPLAGPTFTGTLTAANITATGTVVLPTATSIGDVSYTELSVLNGVASTLTSTELNILDGVTATTAELNKLAGVPSTLTATELGYVDGVTSAIQTQLDAKQSRVYKGDYASDATALALATNDTAKLTPSANRTYTSTVPTAGQRATVIILTSGTSSYTLTFGTGFKTTGTLATGTVDAKVFVISFVSDGTSLIETSRTTAM